MKRTTNLFFVVLLLIVLFPIFSSLIPTEEVPFVKEPGIRDSNNNMIDARIILRDLETNTLETIDLLDNKNKTVSAGNYDVIIIPKNNPIKEITISNLEIENSSAQEIIDLGLDTPKVKASIETVQSYAIDPTSLNFEEAQVTVKAEGNRLFKCTEWDFGTQECNGRWKKIRNLKPGEDYNFTLTPEDPGFLEAGNSVYLLDKEDYLQEYNITETEDSVLISIISETDIKEIKINGLRSMGDIYYEPNTSERGFSNTYSIDPTSIDFENATLKINATGTKLYKCKDWDFAKQKCYGDWKLIENLTLIPGQEYNFTITPEDPGFAEGEAIDVALAPINDEQFVIAWIDKDDKDTSFKIMNTNGSVIVDTIDVDTSNNQNARVSVSMINSTHFAISWIDDPSNDVTRAIYDIQGNQILSPTDVDTNIKTNADVSVAGLGNNFVVCYANDDDDDADFKIYNNQGTETVGESRVDNNIKPQSTHANLVECSGLNSTRFVYFWFDDKSNDASYAILDDQGTILLSEQDIDTKVGNDAHVAVANIGNNMFAMVWYDSDQDDITLAIRDLDNNEILAPTDIDENAGTISRVAISAVRPNSSASEDYFVVAWYKQQELDPIYAAIYDSQGNEITAPFSAEVNPDEAYRLIDIAAHDLITGNELCPGNFIIAYTNSSNKGAFRTYNVNGTEWNGECLGPLANASLQISLMAPQEDTNFTQNQFNEFTVNISCQGSDCGLVNVTLDPLETINSTFQISANNRDAWDDGSDGSLDTCYFGDSDWQDRAGYQFSLPLPKGATIESAYLSLYSQDHWGGDDEYNVVVSVEDIANTSAFTGATSNIYNRDYWSTTIDWEIPEDGLPVNQWSNTPDISQLMQYIVDKEDWQPSNFISFAIWGVDDADGSAEHIIDYHEDPSLAPKLYISWKNTSTKGIISAIPGTLPFWTNKTSNPITINLSDAQSQLITFWVNATGEVNSTYHFFAEAELLNDTRIQDSTQEIDVTILQVIGSAITTNQTLYPQGTSVLIAGSAWGNETELNLTVLFNGSNISGFPVFVTADQNGSFNYTFELEKNQPLGLYSVLAKAELEPANNATANFNVTDNLFLTLSSNYLSPSANLVTLGESITPNANATIDLIYNGSSISGYPKNMTSDSEGIVTDTWTASSTLGNYTLNLTDITAGLNKYDILEVLAPASMNISLHNCGSSGAAPVTCDAYIVYNHSIIHEDNEDIDFTVEFGKQYDVDLNILNYTLQKLEIYNISPLPDKCNVENNLLLDYHPGDINVSVPEIFGGDIKKWYAVVPPNISFSAINISTVAQGNVLLKCTEYDFYNHVCNGSYVMWKAIQPGEDYAILLNATDPHIIEAEGIFFDGFESGSIETNNWNNTGAGSPWNISDTGPRAGKYHIRASDTGNESIIETNISTEGYENITLAFYARTHALDTGEYVAADWYNGTDWINLLQQRKVGPYTLYNFSLSADAENNPDFKIRFRCLSNRHNEYCDIDSVLLQGVFIGPEIDDLSLLGWINSTANTTYLNRTTAEQIEKFYLYANISVPHDTEIDNKILYFRTTNGSTADTCDAFGSSVGTIGNKQDQTCYEWLEARENQDSQTMSASSFAGDGIIWSYVVNTTDHQRINFQIDEHYKPVWKNYPFNATSARFSDQEGDSGKIYASNWRMQKLEGWIPDDASFYTLDFRGNQSATATKPLQVHICNSSYVSGNVMNDTNCILLDGVTKDDMSDPTKWRIIFGQDVLNSIGSLKNASVVFMQHGEANSSNYYSMTQYEMIDPKENHTLYSTNNGTTWLPTGNYTDNTNLNWLYENTSCFQFYIWANATNSIDATSSVYEQCWTTSGNDRPSKPIITNPLDGFVKRGIFTITWLPSQDPQGDIFVYNVSLLNSDGSFNQTIEANIPKGTEASIFNSSIVADGIYRLKVEVCENETAELFCNEYSIGNFTIDNTPPEITFVDPTPNNETINLSYAFINITINEQASQVILNWNGTNETMSGAGTNFYFNETNLSEGNYTFFVYAYDAAGNLGISEILWVYISLADNVNPVIHWINDTPDPVTPGFVINFTANITDDVSVDSVWIRIEGNNYSMNLASGTNTSGIWLYSGLNTSMFYAGIYNYTVYANDTSGNYADSMTSNFSISEVISLVLYNIPINFTSIYAGDTVNATSLQGWPLQVENDGNVYENITISGLDMAGQTNSSYVINVSNILWALDSNFSSSNNLAYSEQLVAGNTAKNYVEDIYFKLYSPLNIISQEYRGNVTLYAVKA